MLRLIIFLVSVALLAAGLSWLADRPGSIEIEWQGLLLKMTVFHAAVLLVTLIAVSVLMWSAVAHLWQSPALVGRFLSRRRQKRGLDALSSGMIAVGAGDRALAVRYAVQARRSLPNEPLTHLLRAQAAQMSGDRATARRIFEAMLASPDTEQIGLRGLFLEAQREGEGLAAEQFAARALRLNPRLAWPVEALLDLQGRRSDWAGALETVNVARRYSHMPKPAADRRRAVLLAAIAQDCEDADTERALTLALEGHALAPDLVPAAAVAARLLAARGNTPRAAKVVERTWMKAPHPDLATAYAFARLGDSPRDRLDRIHRLAALVPGNAEGSIAVAIAAVEARAFDEARRALEPLLGDRLTRRVCLLMARIEAEEHDDKGRSREWLARAVSAGRDPAWSADGVTTDRWLPVSPVTGALDVFQWRVPFEERDGAEAERISRRIDQMAVIDAPGESLPADAPAAVPAKAGPPALAMKTRSRSIDPTAGTDEPGGRSILDGRTDTPGLEQGVARTPPPAAELAPARIQSRRMLDTRAPDDPGPDDPDNVGALDPVRAAS